jgi:hypothetical protein
MRQTLAERLAFEAQLAADLEALVAEFRGYFAALEAEYGPYVSPRLPLERI